MSSTETYIFTAILFYNEKNKQRAKQTLQEEDFLFWKFITKKTNCCPYALTQPVQRYDLSNAFKNFGLVTD